MSLEGWSLRQLGLPPRREVVMSMESPFVCFQHGKKKTGGYSSNFRRQAFRRKSATFPLNRPFAVAVVHFRQLGTFMLRWMEALFAVSSALISALASCFCTIGSMSVFTVCLGCQRHKPSNRCPATRVWCAVCFRSARSNPPSFEDPYPCRRGSSRRNVAAYAARSGELGFFAGKPGRCS